MLILKHNQPGLDTKHKLCLYSVVDLSSVLSSAIWLSSLVTAQKLDSGVWVGDGMVGEDVLLGPAASFNKSRFVFSCRDKEDVWLFGC